MTVKPSAPATNDVLKAVPSGYADLDGDQLTYRYQWLRNGTPISGATSATLNLARPGNGDLNDRIDVDVSAVDAGGGASPTARGGQNVTGTNATPVEGSVALAPAVAEDRTRRSPPRRAASAIRTATRSPTATAGCATAPRSPAPRPPRSISRGRATATAATRSRVEVSAADPGGRASDPAAATVTVANTAPTAGTVTVSPTRRRPTTSCRPCPSGFADADGDAVSYQYQWFRNGTAISGATGRTLDLAEPGNGDAGDSVAVDVTALDGNGGSSAAVPAAARPWAAAPRTRSRPSASRRPPARRSSTRAAATTATLGGATRTQRRSLRPRALVRRRGRHGDRARRRPHRPVRVR